MATSTCICSAGFGGTFCEISIGKSSPLIRCWSEEISLLAPINCVNVTCVNGGVCNPISSTINGIELQCICPDGKRKHRHFLYSFAWVGFAGANCELSATNGRCTANFCQNGGICEEKLTGTTVYAYCRCPSGFTGQTCQTCKEKVIWEEIDLICVSFQHISHVQHLVSMLIQSIVNLVDIFNVLVRL